MKYNNIQFKNPIKNKLYEQMMAFNIQSNHRYECPYCGEKYRLAATCRIHIKSKHKQEAIDEQYHQT